MCKSYCGWLRRLLRGIGVACGYWHIRLLRVCVQGQLLDTECHERGRGDLSPLPALATPFRVLESRFGRLGGVLFAHGRRNARRIMVPERRMAAGSNRSWMWGS